MTDTLYQEPDCFSSHFASEDLLPREKLQRWGGDSLKDKELWAIVLGHGCSGRSVFELASEISNWVCDPESEIEGLGSIKGVGKVAQAKVMAVQELMRRHKKPRGIRLKNPQLVAQFCSDMAGRRYESFRWICLDQCQQLLYSKTFSLGSVDFCAVDIRELFRIALREGASGVLAVHNHPSGILRASEEDLRLTKQLKQAAELLDLSFKDHLIVSEAGWISLFSPRVASW